MQEAMIVVRQVLMMFLLIGLGWVLGKKKMIRDAAVPSMNALVVYIAGPAIMIQSFDEAFSAEKVISLLVCLILSIVVMLTAIAGGRLLFNKSMNMAQYACVFNNCGFIGIPLVQAVLGEEAIFYLTIFMAVWNLFAWTYGLQTLKGSSAPLDWRKIAFNPATVAVVLGTLLFLSPFRLPAILDSVLRSAGGMNTPLAMIVLGFAMTKIHWKTGLQDWMVWKITAARLVIIPLATLAVLSLTPQSMNQIRMTLLTAACTPVGAMLTMFQGMLHQDTTEGSLLVSVSTLFSMITLPLILSAASLLWHL